MSASSTIADAFDTFNRLRLQSRVLEDVWRQAYGQEYAAEARPDGFYPLSVLEAIIAAASERHASGTGEKALLDIGCGHGMTGLFLAQRLKWKLLGIDISPASIALAQKNASGSEVAASRFWVADASSTELEPNACALVTCLDVLLYFPDKLAVLKEIHRILEPKGLFAFTTWEQHGYNPRLGAQQVDDYRPLLKEAGFDILRYEPVEGAGELQRRCFEGLIAGENALREELGDGPASMFVKMAKSAKDESGGRRYVFGIALRKDN